MLWSERSQYEKPAYCMLSTMWNSGKRETMETVKRLLVPRVRGEGGLNRHSTKDL